MDLDFFRTASGMRAGPKTNALVIALAAVVMAAALAVAFGYAQLPSHASAGKAARTMDANGNSIVGSR